MYHMHGTMVTEDSPSFLSNVQSLPKIEHRDQFLLDRKFAPRLQKRYHTVVLRIFLLVLCFLHYTFVRERSFRLTRESSFEQATLRIYRS